MKLRLTALFLMVGLTTVLLGQDQSASTVRRDDAYVGVYKKLPGTGLDEPNGEDPQARVEWMKERFGGDLGSDFTQLVIDETRKDQEITGIKVNGAVAPGTPGQWFSIGPVRSNWIQNGVRVTKSDTGRLRTILPHPSNPDVVYLLTSGGGLWKTSNFASPRPDWAPMTDALPSMSGGSIAFGASPQTLYYGIGDPFDIGVGGAMFKSSDGGRTWTLSAILSGASTVTDVKVDTTVTPEIVLVGTNNGLFRSTDAGLSYTRVISPVSRTQVGPTTFVANVVWSIVQGEAGWVANAVTGGTLNGALFLSTNHGETWNPISGAPLAGIARTTLGVGAPGDRVVYAFASGTFTVPDPDPAKPPHAAFGQMDLFRSADGGLTWTALDLRKKKPVNPTTYLSDMDVMADQPTYNQMILVDPTDSLRNTVYIGGEFASAKTSDGGATWRVATDWLALDNMPYVHADFHAAALSTAGGHKTLFFGSDGGLFISTDEGRSWSDQKNDGVGSYLVYAMATAGTNPDDVLIGLQDNGTRLRFGQTAVYNQVIGGDGFGAGWSQANNAASLGSLYYSRIFRNVKGAAPSTQQKWFLGTAGIGEVNSPSTTYFVTSIATPPATADETGLVFFTRTRNKVYKTANGAANWSLFWESPKTTVDNNGDGKPDVDSEGNPILVYTRVVRAGSHPIGVSPQDVNHVGIALNGGRVVFTADGGETWADRFIGSLLGNGAPAPGSLAPGWAGFNSTVAYASNDTIYIGSESPSAVQFRVAKSQDGGATWTPLPLGGLPNLPVTKLLVSSKDANTLLAATWIGVYRSTDGGTTWSRYGGGLPYAIISDLYMPPDGSFLRASSYGRGVWDIR